MWQGKWVHALSAALLLTFSPFAPAAPTIAAPDNPARQYFTDTILLDQNGRPHRFYSDLIAGRVVVISVIFTGCRSSCPILMGQLTELQDLLGPKMGQVKFLSLSVDPVMDTPEALHAYAADLQAGPDWHFLTGPKQAVSTVLARLGDRSMNPEDHSNVVVVGNDATGTWLKLTAIATAEDLALAIAEVEKKPAD